MEGKSLAEEYGYPAVSHNTASGHPGHTTPEQDALLLQFRSELQKEGYTERLDTHTLVCFSSSYGASVVVSGHCKCLTLHPLMIASIPPSKEIRSCTGQADVSPTLLAF